MLVLLCCTLVHVCKCKLLLLQKFIFRSQSLWSLIMTSVLVFVFRPTEQIFQNIRQEYSRIQRRRQLEGAFNQTEACSSSDAPSTSSSLNAPSSPSGQKQSTLLLHLYSSLWLCSKSPKQCFKAAVFPLLKGLCVLIDLGLTFWLLNFEGALTPG